MIWPIVPMLVDVYLQGIAFGLMTSFQNLAQCAIPTLVSYILMTNEKYLYNSTHDTSKMPSTTMMIGISQCEFLFSLLSLFGVITGSILWFLDEYPQNNTPRGVLRATTKFSFEEIERRRKISHFPPKLSSLPNIPNEHSVQSSTSSSTTTTSTTTSSTSSVSNYSSLYHSRHDIETPTLISTSYNNNYQLNDLERGNSGNEKSNNDDDENEVVDIDTIHYPQPDRSDWVLYDPSSSNNRINNNMDDNHTPVTEMTPLITRHSSSLIKSNDKNNNNNNNNNNINNNNNNSLFPTTRIMPRRSSSILRHHSVYSPSKPGPHGPYHIHKSISFAGDQRVPERKAGQGQHPSIPLARRNSLNLHHFRISHF